MRERIIRFFLKKHLLTNLFFITIFIGGILSWQQMRKEELPDITFDRVRISVQYPGASAEEVEYYVTRHIEEAVRSIDGVYSVTSSTGEANCNVTAEIEQYHADKDAVITDIRNTVLDVDLPDDIIDDPNIRVFKTSRKAIIDIGLYYKGKNILDVKSRKKLQSYALALENQLLSLDEISEVNMSGYLKDEIHIKIYPDKLIDYQIPFNTVINEIQNNNVRQPAGNIENKNEPKVTLFGELGDIESLKNLAVQGGFEGQVVRLGDIADIEKGYEKTKAVIKINGHEGIFLNAVKTSRVGIVEAIESLKKTAESFSRNSLGGTGIELVLLDDESVDVRNRLFLISMNGIIGFLLILICLFIFLDFRSGLWVAMGIPFTFCFTIIVTLMMGYSINNITLAAVIIVMGMVVDDAIVVSENITRYRSSGMNPVEASAKGTEYVVFPIIASIFTTCVAFVPLFFFGGRFGVMVRFIPPIIFCMLGGSFLESIIVLPGHMLLPIGTRVDNFLKKRFFKLKDINKHWFDKWEDVYGAFTEKVLPIKWLVFLFFIFLLALSWHIVESKMKFVMFPDEETRQIRLSAEAPAGSKRYQTARLAQSYEDVISDYIGKEVIGFRNYISRSRWGSAAQENKLTMRIEILPREKRVKSADQIIKEWEEKFSHIEGLNKVRLSKTRHAQESAVEIMVKENNDALRRKVADELAASLEKHPALYNIEIERPIMNPEYRIRLNRDKLRRLAISPSDIARTLRAALEGKILYELMGDDEKIYVRLTTVESAKDDIEKVLNIPVENQGKYLVPLKEIVNIEEVTTPDSISREDEKRTTVVYAGLKEESGKTPLEIADYLENNVLPDFNSAYPSTVVEFAGEIKDTRESQRDFMFGIVMAIVLIYIILALLFESLARPFIIMLTIPFSVVGIVLAFWFHGISMYGFFAVIGALGLAGVVVNDAIIMLVKLYDEYPDKILSGTEHYKKIASIAKTRLRAVILTTLTTVIGIVPTAYGWAGYDSMLAQMMLALAWGLLFGTMITLLLIPCIFSFNKKIKAKLGLKQVKVITLSVIFVLTGICYSRAEETDHKTVTLEEFIKTVCEKDTVFQEILADQLILKYKKALRLPAGDLVVSLKSQYEVFLDDNEGDPENTVSLSKLFPYVGTDVTLDYSSSVSLSSRAVSSDFELKISQPIAENAFGRSTKLLDKIVGLEIEVADYQIAEAYEDYLASLINTYYNWYFAYRNMETGQHAYKENLKLLENVKDRARNNIALPIDVNKVDLQVLAKKENLVSLEDNYVKYLNLVKQALRYKDDRILLPEEPDFYDNVEVEFERDYSEFEHESRTCEILALLTERSALEVDRDADKLLPSIDIFAGFATDGTGQTLREEDETAYAGFSFEWPLPGQAEKAEYETSRIELKKAALSEKNTHFDIFTRLRNLNESIEKERELIEISNKKIALAEEIVKDETENYSYGRTTLNDLIDEVNKLEDNKFNKIYHTIELRKLILDWLRLTDRLVLKDRGEELF